METSVLVVSFQGHLLPGGACHWGSESLTFVTRQQPLWKYLVYIVGVSPSIHRVQKLLSLASFMAFLEHYCTDGNLSKARTGISFSINIKKKKKLSCQQQAWHKHLIHISYEENIKNACLLIIGKTEDTLGELLWFPYLLGFLEGCLVPLTQAFSWRWQDLNNPVAAARLLQD